MSGPVGSSQWMYNAGADFTLDQSLRFIHDDDPALIRTPATTTNRRTFTISAWVKRGNLGVASGIFGTEETNAAGTDGEKMFRLKFENTDNIGIYTDNPSAMYIESGAKFRDSAAWYHVVCAVDTTQATNTNRLKIYINGTQLTTFTGNYPAQNLETAVNYTHEHRVGKGYTNEEMEGYIAEFHFIDGTALTPTSFGEAGDYGDWKPIEVSGLTYGTNGFYLPFKQDYSVEGFSALTYKGDGTASRYMGGTGFQPDLVWIKQRGAGVQDHVLFDSVRGPNNKIKANEVDAEFNDTNALQHFDTDGFTVGADAQTNDNGDTYVAWNWDMGGGGASTQHTVTASGATQHSTAQYKIGSSSILFDGTNDYLTAAASSNFDISGGCWTVEGWFRFDAFSGSQNQMVSIYLDANDFLTITMHPTHGLVVTHQATSTQLELLKNSAIGDWSTNTWYHIAVVINGTNLRAYVNGTCDTSNFAGTITKRSTSGNYKVDIGISDTFSGDEMDGYIDEFRVSDCSRYTDNFTPQTTPFSNSAKGTVLLIHSDTTNTSTTFTDSSGTTTRTFSTNGDGSITSYVAANTTYGQSVVSYTGTGSAATIGHGLSAAPEMIIVKNRDAADAWRVYHSHIAGDAETDWLELNDTTLATDDAGVWNDTAPTSTVFSVATESRTNEANEDFVAYCFDSVTGYSKFGSYTGKGGDTSAGITAAVYGVGEYVDSNGAAASIDNNNSTLTWFLSTSATGGIKYDYGSGVTKTINLVKLSIGQTYSNDNDKLTNISIKGSNDDSSYTTLNSDDNVKEVGGNPSAGDFNIQYSFENTTAYRYYKVEFTNTGTYPKFYEVELWEATEVTLGFAPAFVLIKSSSQADSWTIYDNTRQPSFQPARGIIYANTNAAEDVSNDVWIELGANSFKWHRTGTGFNVSGQTYIYAAFADKREYAYWLDQSGNNNDWASQVLTESDIMLDTPTNNFCTLNPLSYAINMSVVMTEASLQTGASGSSGAPKDTHGTIPVTTGKWYFETLVTNASGGNIGLYRINGLNNGQDELITSSATLTSPFCDGEGWALVLGNGNKEHAGSNVSFDSQPAVGSIIMTAFDMDNGKIWFGKNGIWLQSGNPTTAANPVYTGETFGVAVPALNAADGGIFNVNFGQDSSFAGKKSPQGNQDSNSIGDFYYEPPTDFLAICTSNLPAATYAPITPSEHFSIVQYTGNAADGSTTDNAITGVGFQPDFLWIKKKDANIKHMIFDVLRGVTKHNSTNVTTADITSDQLTSFDSDGFTVSNSSGGTQTNDNNQQFVAWNWLASSAASGTSTGSGTGKSYSARYNTDAGFSIISFIGNDTAGHTIPHHLGSAPEFIIVKATGHTDPWMVLHKGVHASYETDNLEMNSIAALDDSAIYWNDTEPTSSVFTLGTSNNVNGDNDTYIAYCWRSIEGYSKVGSYFGNNNTNGCFVYTGFRPQYVWVKNIDNTGNWVVIDTNRSANNEMDDSLHLNASALEAADNAYRIDFLSNGFKLRGDAQVMNDEDRYVFFAIAETPFKYANAF